MRPSTYFIRAGTDGPIKIGKADSVECRLQSLQTAHYEKLVVLAVVDEPERYVQRRFATDRIRGEWFFPSETLLAYIANFPGAREPPKVQLNPMSWNYDRKTQPADRLVSALMEYGALFLPGDLLRMINGSRIGPHDYNRLTKQNAIDMAVLFTARYARLRSHEKMILEAEASVESSSRVIALREELAVAPTLKKRREVEQQLRELGAVLYTSPEVG